MNKQTYNYLKIYQRTTETEYRSPLFQFCYLDSIYKFSIEKLACRIFFENDYKLYTAKTSYISNQYRIVLYIKGHNSIMPERKKILCEEGTLLLLSPGQQPSAMPKSKGELTIAVLAFDFMNDAGDFLKVPFHKLLSYYMCKHIDEREYLLLLNRFQKEKLITIFDYLYKVLPENKLSDGIYQENHSLDFLSVGEAMLQIFYFLADQVFNIKINKPAKDTSPLSKARERIEAIYNGKLTISKLAEDACLSETHFLHAFKKAYGISPIHYQLQLRIAEAKNLLVLTTLSCKVIAANIGINNVYYFSKLFKKHTGMSPTVYREKFQNY